MTDSTITLDQLTNAGSLARRTYEGFEIRTGADSNGKREIEGIGVPYGSEFATDYFRERFEPGAIKDDAGALAYWQHRDPIGKVSASKDTDAGRHVKLSLSDTQTATEAHTLASDGVVRGLSVGFRPVKWREEHDETGDLPPLIIHEEVVVREYSLVPFPAYADAQISNVRAHPTTNPTPPAPPAPKEEEPMSDSTVTLTRDDLDAATGDLTTKIEDIQRQMAEWTPGTDVDELATRAEEFQSFGDWVQAIADERESRHDNAMTLYRDITTSDVPSKLVNTPGFIGDLTKRIVERRRWTNKFRSRPLPSKGMSVDYIKTVVTATIAEQENELDALAKGAGFQVLPDSSKVRTFGGAETVSRQVIDRSEAWALTGMFEAFGLQYGRQTEAATKLYITDKIAERLASEEENSSVAVPDDFGAFDWIDTLVDVAGIFEDRGYDLKELALSPDRFKQLAREAGTDGRPLLTVSGSSTGTNVVGHANLPAGSGELLRLPVSILHGATNQGLFYDPVAIETLESPGAPFWLQEDNVLNLSRDYACYGYMAHITPHPQALMPVSFGTETTEP